MCVYISEDGGKVVELPPFIVRARRINNLQLEMVLERLRLVWNPTSGTFDMVREGGGVSIVPVDQPLPRLKPEDDRPYDAWEIVGTTIVNGYVVQTIEFRKDGVLVDAKTYIYAGGEFWMNNGESWFSIQQFGPHGATWRPGVLPPANVTPPEGRGGGDDIAQH